MALEPDSSAASIDPEPPAAVLLVDDRSEDLLGLEAVLSNENLELVTARSGAEALRRILERDFAAIVLDVVMPGMDGFQLARLIRSRERTMQTPILFITGLDSDVAALYRAYAIGAVDYLIKPVDGDILRAKLGVFVALHQKDQRIRAQSRALLEAEQKNRELELAREKLLSARRYRNLADAVPHIVWTANREGQITYFNRRWAEYTGVAQDDGTRSWLDAVHPDERTDCETRWRTALLEGQPYEAECRLRDSTGRYRWHLCRARPDTVDEEIVGWLGTHTDLDDIFMARQRAENAIRARDEFLSIASHELRTPLSALLVQLGSLEHMLAKTDFGASPIGAKANNKVCAALRHTGRLGKLVDTLLDVSRLATKHLDMELAEYDLADVVRDVVERFNDEATQAGCEIVTRAPPGVVGTWDRLRIEQVVTNLLSNAIKYGRSQPIEVTVDTDGTSAQLTIRDRGIGIPTDDQDRIFDRFERAAPVQHYGGLGLGLYIARKIVEAHDGSIVVSSRPHEGASFTVTLPRLQSASGQGGVEPRSSQ